MGWVLLIDRPRIILEWSFQNKNFRKKKFLAWRSELVGSTTLGWLFPVCLRNGSRGPFIRLRTHSLFFRIHFQEGEITQTTAPALKQFILRVLRLLNVLHIKIPITKGLNNHIICAYSMFKCLLNTEFHGDGSAISLSINLDHYTEETASCQRIPVIHRIFNIMEVMIFLRHRQKRGKKATGKHREQLASLVRYRLS